MRRIRGLPEGLGHSRAVLVPLRELYLLAGEPSMRKMEQSTRHAVSRDTAHRILTGPELPRWEPLEHIVKALGGDVAAFRELWVSARRAMEEEGG
jgi:hypothetical protein